MATHLQIFSSSSEPSTLNLNSDAKSWQRPSYCTFSYRLAHVKACWLGSGHSPQSADSTLEGGGQPGPIRAGHRKRIAGEAFEWHRGLRIFRASRFRGMLLLWYFRVRSVIHRFMRMQELRGVAAMSCPAVGALNPRTMKPSSTRDPETPQPQSQTLLHWTGGFGGPICWLLLRHSRAAQWPGSPAAAVQRVGFREFRHLDSFIAS